MDKEMEHEKLFIKGIENQNTIAKILFENGYTVRLVTTTIPNSKTKVKAVEYWKEGKSYE